MINLYCDFPSNKRKAYKILKEQKSLSQIFATKEFILGQTPSFDLIDDFSFEMEIRTNLLINCDFYLLDQLDLYEKIISREATIASSRYLLVKAKSLPSFFQALVTDLGKIGIVLVFLHNLADRLNIDDFPLGVMHMLNTRDILSFTKRKTSLSLIEKGYISFVGGTKIIKAKDLIEKNLGPETAFNIFYKNPASLLADKSIC